MFEPGELGLFKQLIGTFWPEDWEFWFDVNQVDWSLEFELVGYYDWSKEFKC